MPDRREETAAPPTQGVEPPTREVEEGSSGERPPEEGSPREAKADEAVEPDQPTFPPPPPEGTETTERVKPEDLPESP